jgi:CRISPR-associated endonuclease/helicase Cas3
VVRVERAAAAAAWAEVARAVGAGARVLALRSTVADAIATRDELRRLGLAPVLHHSRWHPADRERLDRDVLALLGKERADGPGRVVVATQTCEQALDLDADLLVADACPGAVLLQRLGRLHRHERRRPEGYRGTPRCLLLDTDPAARLVDWRDAPLPHQRGGPGEGWAWVYPAAAVQGCLDELDRLGGVVTLPADARRLVERSSHPEALAALADRGPAWRRAWEAQRLGGLVARQGGGPRALRPAPALVYAADQVGAGAARGDAGRGRGARPEEPADGRAPAGGAADGRAARRR